MTSLKSWTTLAALAGIIASGCGSQQLRLASPETSAGIAYTCTSASACYPASVASPAEGQEAEAIVLTLPPECGGHIHQIVVREPDSSAPEIDVTCARQRSAPPAPGSGVALTRNP
jgi:hypothetical protein